jgi:SNF2 family DNA or RNA helicase
MFYFVDPRTWDGMNFYQFREKYFFKIESGGIPMYFFNKKYTEEINARIFRKGLRVLKSEVQKYLPEKIFIKHLLDMPQKAKDIYDTFDEHGVCGDIFTFFSIVQRTKLMQMANGSIINDQMGQDKEIIFLHDVKLKEVDRLLEDEIPQEEQVIIWANFEEDFAKLHELTGYPMICGGVNYKQTVRDFKDGKIKGIIAHPKSISWGVTFIKCHYNIYYGLPDDLECFSQSLDRCHRQGQKNNVTIYLLLCRDTIDEAILKIHEKNKTLENTLSYDDTLKSSNFRILVGSNLI